MEMITVHGSSNIASRGYEESTRTLAVGFHNKGDIDHPRIYHYAGVPISVWHDWLQAASAGAFFAARIKNVYPSTRIS